MCYVYYVIVYYVYYITSKLSLITICPNSNVN